MKTARARVLIVYTGGTFGMALRPSGALKIPNISSALLRARLEEHLPEMNRLAHCDVEIAMNCDSAHIGPEQWVQIAKLIRSKWKNYDGVVVLHGTDTLAYTASALSFLLRPCRCPIVLTGAQRPLAAIRTDARRNLVSAIEIAAARFQVSEGVPNQVMVFFDDHLLQGNRTRKRSASEFDAFETPNDLPLAVVGTEIRYRETKSRVRPKRSKLPPVTPVFSRKVAMFHLTPGFPARSIQEGLLSQLDALVLIAFSSGTGPTHDPAFIELIRSARRAQVPVIVVSEGATFGTPSTYAAGRLLLKLGCQWAGSMTPEAAFVKTSLLMGQPNAHQSFGRLWSADFAGETGGWESGE